MRMMQNHNYTLLPFEIIEEAVTGDAGAINTVLRHYERHIVTLSTRTLYDETGTPHFCVDEELKRRLETKLITKILDFKVDRRVG